MALYRTKAIVLRTKNFGEADRVLVLLSEDCGKFEVIVKGARRPRSRFVGNTLAFNFIKTMLLSGKNLDTLSQAEVIHSFSLLREDLTKLAYASFWVELVDGFIPERQAANEIFRFLLASFIVLEKTVEPAILNMAFEIRLLDYLGYQPQIDSCTGCDKLLENMSSFSAVAGGVLCSNCETRYSDLIPINKTDLKILDQLRATDLRELDNFVVRADSYKVIQKILMNFIETRLDHPIKSRVFLDNLSS